MDIEFHYYVNYIIAVQSGFSVVDAYKIAYSAQYVDDNNVKMRVYNNVGKTWYENIVTQTYAIYQSKDILNKIFPVYHFLPACFKRRHSIRNDQAIHALETIPDCMIANLALQKALRSGDVYWIGIASHAFVDTWAHQNFTGTIDNYNALYSCLKSSILNIGHADAGCAPDQIGYVWYDNRLLKSKIENNVRFIHAALRLLEEYMDFLCHAKHVKKKVMHDFQNNIKRIFGKSTRSLLLNYCNRSYKRMPSYHALASLYSGFDIIKYDKISWSKKALVNYKDDFSYAWKDCLHYRKQNWYLFQEAVKKHHDFIWLLIKHQLN